MDSIKAFEQLIQVITTAKTLMITGSALTIYDHLLMIDDEIRYMWKGRKTFIFYLYILNRIPLTTLRLWQIYVASSPRSSESGCITESSAETLLELLFFSSSDIFIALRIYAITFRNKFLAAYLGTLALARLALSLAASFLRPVTFLDLPKIPIDAFNLCPVVAHYQLKPVAGAFGTAFDISAFLAIAWCAYRSTGTLKLSAVIRTIVAEGTMYFLAMVALQIYVQLSLGLMEGISQQFSMIAYGVINPMLTMRFALSLKRSADSRREWKGTQLSLNSINIPMAAARASTATYEGIEMGPFHPPNGLLQPRG